MSDAREALARLVRTLDAKSAEDQERLGRYWDQGLADGDVQEDVYRRTDAILAEFDVTPRGERDDSDVHDHKWQRRQNVTSRGYRMTPYEVCVVDGCDAARQLDEPPAPRGEDQWWESLVEAPCDQGHRVFIDDGDGGVYACPACAPPTVKPSVEALADALAAEGIDAEPGDLDLTPTAERLLALLPGRTEAEVYKEGYNQGLRDAASVSRSEAEVKIEALRWAASVAVADDEGIPWDDDHDRAVVSTWLLGLAARVAQGERGGP